MWYFEIGYFPVADNPSTSLYPQGPGESRPGLQYSESFRDKLQTEVLGLIEKEFALAPNLGLAPLYSPGPGEHGSLKGDSFMKTLS